MIKNMEEKRKKNDATSSNMVFPQTAKDQPALRDMPSVIKLAMNEVSLANASFAPVLRHGHVGNTRDVS